MENLIAEENRNTGRNIRPSVGRILTRPEDFESSHEPQTAGALRYSFIGLSSGVGTTSLTFAFAEHLIQTERAACKQKKGSARRPRSVTVLEVGDAEAERRGYNYDRIGCDRRFAGRDFASCYALTAAGRSIRGVSNLDSGINWLLRIPDEPQVTLDAQDYMRMIAGTPGDIVLCDFSGSFGSRLFGGGTLGRGARAEFLHRILIDSDKVFVVIDPLPSAMMADPESLELFKTLEASGTSVTYIVNKMNPGINRRELKAFLRLRRPIEIPHFDPAAVYTAEYNCCTLYAMPKVSAQIKPSFEQMTL
jgi:hypothetical protein